MKTFKRFSALVILSTLASACGGQAYREAVPTGGGLNPGNGGGGYNWGGPGTPNPSPSPSSDPSGGGSLPAYSADFTLKGRGGVSSSTDTTVSPYVYTTGSVETDNLLRVKVTALPGSQITATNGSGSNFTANYGCVKYTVKVNGTVRQTQVLRVGGVLNSLCPTAPESEILDFSSILAAGHHSLTVQVTEARYDFYCQMFQPQILNCGTSPFTYQNSYCSYQPSTWWQSNYCTNGYGVWQTHNVNGRLQIQVNGTTL